jgi:hypothetical protein
MPHSERCEEAHSRLRLRRLLCGKAAPFRLMRMLYNLLQPLAAADLRADGNWQAIQNTHRAHSNLCHLRSQVEIGQRENGFELSMDVRGTDGVPPAVEITLRPGGRLTGDALTPLQGMPGGYLLGEGFVTYELAGRRLRIGPGVRRHSWTQLRGAQPRLPGVTLYLTDFTPFNKTIQFVAG